MTARKEQDMKEREALKPCPFCGGEASQRTEHDSDMVRWGYIGCRCGVRTRGKFGDLCPTTWAEIRAEWNARASIEASQAQEAATPKPLDDPRLQELFSSAISGALAFGAQGVNPPPQGHWLTQFWNMARAERATKEPPPAAQEAAEPDPQLLKFYAVNDYPSLVAAMEHHIERLQAKLPKNDQPAFTRVRA